MGGWLFKERKGRKGDSWGGAQVQRGSVKAPFLDSLLTVGTVRYSEFNKERWASVFMCMCQEVGGKGVREATSFRHCHYIISHLNLMH